MTDAQFAAWLKRNPATYTVLCQIDYVDESNLGSPLPGHLYLATLAYSDATNGRQWRDLIHELPSYSRNLSGDGLRTFASTIGTLVLNNADGRSDYIADLFLDGSDVAFYVGDTSWPIADFRLIYVATATKVTVPSQERLNIEMRDTGILLNRTIGGDVKVGGEGPNADQFRPVNIGYVAQAAAILSDVDTQTFVYNDTGDGLWLGATEQVVRDNGYPVDFTDNGDGSLTLTDQPVGTITTNVMATPAGDEANRLVSDVMDELIGNRAGLADAGLYDGAQDTFEVMGDEDWPLGLNITERRNIVDVLSDVCDSGLCFWAISRLNHFFYGRLRPGYLAVLAQDFSPVPAGRLITADHVRDGSFAREVADPQWHKLQIYVSRNWAIPGTTVSTDTSGDPRILTPEDLAIVTRRGLAVIQGDSVGVSYETAPELYHKTLSESPALDTLLSDADDAEATLVADAWMEPARSNQLPWLHTVSVRVPLEFYELELGAQVQLQYPRFGYDYGVQFQVIGVDIALLARDIGLRLLRRHVQQPYAGRETAGLPTPFDDFTFDGTITSPPMLAPITLVAESMPGMEEADGVIFGGEDPDADTCTTSVPAAELGQTRSGVACYTLPMGYTNADITSYTTDDLGGMFSLDGEFVLTSVNFPTSTMMRVFYEFTPIAVVPNSSASYPNASKQGRITVTYSDLTTSEVALPGTVNYTLDGYIVLEPSAGLPMGNSAGANTAFPTGSGNLRWKWSASVPADYMDSDGNSQLTQVWGASPSAIELVLLYDATPQVFGPNIAIPANEWEFKYAGPGNSLRALTDVVNFNPLGDLQGKILTYEAGSPENFIYPSGDGRLMAWTLYTFNEAKCLYGYQHGATANGTRCILSLKAAADVDDPIDGVAMPIAAPPYSDGEALRNAPRRFNW